ncbi:MAG TPA: ArsB/NhaD family transporter [Roseiflexaceae bacterium]|nr:ArsB/NhaD family transporter [Roseiflexaceae bacterium]
MTVSLTLSLLVFGATYVAITLEKVHKTIAALAGAVLMLLLGLISQERAFEHVDWNVIFLLAGMMIIANGLQQTGVFQFVAIQLVKAARAKPRQVLIYLAGFAALVSAVLDNVTTVVLVTPLVLFLAHALHISPLPFLIAVILASNIGGTATLIGDPPNVIIGSAAGLDFAAFLVNLAPVALLVFAVFVPTILFLFRHDLRVDAETRAAVMELDTAGVIKDRRMLAIALGVLGLVIVGFLLQGVFHYEAATIALGGAVLIALFEKRDIHELLSEIEWTTLFFFFGLFIVVGALIEVGLIEIMAHGLLGLTGGDLSLTTMLLLWLSGAASAIVDNIPYTATMVPIVQQLGAGMPSAPLWWALALGACLGGNATLVGASANVIVAGLAERAGYPISFGAFLKYGLIITLESLLIASVYIWLRYL